MVDSDLLGIDSSCYCCIVLIYGYWTEIDGLKWSDMNSEDLCGRFQLDIVIVVL